jgi:TonB-dependent SusC/RagA subfamily outer membrane receptor
MPLLIVLAVITEGCSRARSGPDVGPMPTRRTNSNVVTAADIQQYPMVSTVEELLVRLVPGIHVVRGSDGQPAVHIMGLSTGRQGGGALYVIDGVPVSTGGSIGLNPRDVQRIEVVRDGGTALYGFRGANGVIVITTKTQDLL